MAMNRVQFQAGLSMQEFLERYGTEDQCRAALQAARWPNGFACAACGGSARTSFERGGLRYRQCGGCARQTSLISGTVFEASKLPLSRWFLAMQLLTQAKNNVSALELKRQLGLSYRSAWSDQAQDLGGHAAGRGRARARRTHRDRRCLLRRRVLRRQDRPRHRQQGAVLAAVQTSPQGHPLYACLSPQRPTSEAMAAFAAKHIAPSATVVSDGMWCFRAAELVGAEHQRFVTRGGKAAVRLPQFKAVNTLLGNLKTAITDTYHAFDFAKYAHRYLAEFQFRFNRRFDMKTILHRLLHSLIATPASPERWLRTADIHR